MCVSSDVLVLNFNLILITRGFEGRDSVAGIATWYELDGPGIESQWEWHSPHRSDWLWGRPNILHNGYPVSFPKIKRLDNGVTAHPI
jgi:hypothetical protein